MKLRKSDWIAVVIALVFFQLMCLWCIDVSTSTMLMEKTIISQQGSAATGALTNGFFNLNPLITYHVGLYILVIACFLIALIAVHSIIQNPREIQKHP
jgi:TRAP-type C4-dicarboxylate transport system permease small subunit